MPDPVTASISSWLRGRTASTCQGHEGLCSAIRGDLLPRSTLRPTGNSSRMVATGTKGKFLSRDSPNGYCGSTSSRHRSGERGRALFGMVAVVVGVGSSLPVQAQPSDHSPPGASDGQHTRVELTTAIVLFPTDQSARGYDFRPVVRMAPWASSIEIQAALSQMLWYPRTEPDGYQTVVGHLAAGYADRLVRVSIGPGLVHLRDSRLPGRAFVHPGIALVVRLGPEEGLHTSAELTIPVARWGNLPKPRIPYRLQLTIPLVQAKAPTFLRFRHILAFGRFFSNSVSVARWLERPSGTWTIEAGLAVFQPLLGTVPVGVTFGVAWRSSSPEGGAP